LIWGSQNNYEKVVIDPWLRREDDRNNFCDNLKNIYINKQQTYHDEKLRQAPSCSRNSDRKVKI
jgi:hypothetical protein